MSRIVLGVSAGIAAYKACALLRLFVEAGHEVEVVPTAQSLKFVGEPTWAALSGRPVCTDVFAHADQVNHVRIGREADLIMVAPATADLISRAAAGRADDLLTNVLLTATCPVVMAPAMHTEMWLHPATQANVATLRSRGTVVLDPASGRLTGPDSGPGRLPEPADLEATALAVLAEPFRAEQLAGQDLAGTRIVVSAGGTREPLDPVRFLGNVSSGLMGVGLARAAATRGAQVTLIGANLAVPAPAAIEVVSLSSAAELGAAMATASADADVVVMAAAVADFAPATVSSSKIKKDGRRGLAVELVQTADILAGLAAVRPAGQVVVGFAAETAADDQELVALGTAKLANKGCQVLVLNDVSDGAVFGEANNDVTIVSASGVENRSSGSKTSVAHAILDTAMKYRERKPE
jgi:phosphopantothenoylcysteine decarboxylase / phosphopantothenate---cysteine ligase